MSHGRRTNGSNGAALETANGTRPDSGFMAGCRSRILHVNKQVEHFFYLMGQHISRHAMVYAIVPTVLFTLIGLGIVTATIEGDLYKLWIESDSRLHAEANWRKTEFAEGLDRTEYQLVQSTTPGANLLSEENIERWLDLHKRVYNNVTVKHTNAYLEPVGQEVTYTYDTLCSRLPMDPFLAPLLAAGDQAVRLPCTRISMMDCWKEGNYDFSLRDPIPSMYVTLGAFGVKPVYDTVPSFRGRSFEQLANDLKNSCKMWAGVTVPENFMYAAHRQGGDPHANITSVVSFETAHLMLTPASLAQSLLDKKCQQSCLDTCTANFKAALFTRASPLNCAQSLANGQGACIATATTCGNNCVAQAGACVGACTATRTGCNNVCYASSCQVQCSNSTCDAQCDVDFPNVSWQNNTDCHTACNVTARATTACTNCACVGGCSASFGGCANGCNNAALQCGGVCQTNATVCITAAITNNLLGCVQAGSLLPTVVCNKACANLDCNRKPNDAELNEATNIIRAWEGNYIALMQSADSLYPGWNMAYFSDRSTGDLVEEASGGDTMLIALGYVLLVLYTMFAMFDWSNSVRSQSLVAIAALFTVALGVFSALGLSALVGLPFNPITVQVLPFVGLGLGCSDMFNLLAAFKYNPALEIDDMIGETLKDSGPAIFLATICNLLAFGIGASLPLPGVAIFSAQCALSTVTNLFTCLLPLTAAVALDAKRISKSRMDCFPCVHKPEVDPSSFKVADTTPKWVIKFADLMCLVPVQIGIVVVFIVLAAVAIYGATQTVVGLPLSDIVPSSHYSSNFLKHRAQYYGDYPNAITTGMGVSGKAVTVDWPNVMLDWFAMEQELMNVPLVNQDVPITTGSWPNLFTRWYDGKVKAGTKAGNPTRKYNHPVWGSLFLPPLNRDDYYVSLQEWASDLGNGVYATQLHWDESTNPPHLRATESGFYFTRMNTDEKCMKGILDTRAVTDKYRSKLQAFPAGFVYDFYEQYLKVDSYLVLNLIYTGIGVFLISSLFLLSIQAAAIMMADLIIIVLMVYGFLTFWDIKINSVCVVNLMLAVALSVDLTVRVVHIFDVSKGTRNERMRTTLRRLTVPIIHSSLSAFLCVISMAFAKFPYFRIYFFNMYFLITVFSFINGLFLLPLLMKWFGPSTISMEEAPTSYNQVDPKKTGNGPTPLLKD